MAATDASRRIGATTGASRGIGATTGAPAKSLLDAGDTAQSQRLGRPQADSIVAAKQERSA